MIRKSEDDDDSTLPRIPQCLKALPNQMSAQLMVGAQRLDVSLARIVCELRADIDGSVFGVGWPRSKWPLSSTKGCDRGEWLTAEAPEGIALALCSASSNEV